MASTIFCSDLGAVSGEPLAGSAPDFQGFIFISWPKGHWARKPLESRGLAPALKDYLYDVQMTRSIATRLIAPSFRSAPGCEIYFYPHRLCATDVPVSEIQAVIEAVLTKREHPKVTTDEHIRVFCCTHGKRDRCCAKFGFAVVKEIRRLAALEYPHVVVHESTHLGGDRFAASALVFPHGHMYGRLRPQLAGALLEAISGPTPYALCFRGSVYLRGAAQTAEAIGYSSLHAQGIDGRVTVIEERHTDAAHRTVTMRIETRDGVHLQVLSLKQQAFPVVLDCAAADRKSEATVMRWVEVGWRETSGS